MAERHATTVYPVMGEDDESTNDFVFAMRQNFPMLPDSVAWTFVDMLRQANDLYGAAL